MSYPNIIAIDGPAASGKSTLAERLAAKLAYLYFDTGVMYRAVTLAALDKFQSVDNEISVTQLANEIRIDVKTPTVKDGRKYTVLVDDIDVTWRLHEPCVDSNVSKVSAYAGVRAAMTQQQREIGSRGKVVMVGRDIGTVVFPSAGLKIYLEASAEERARRRCLEIENRGEYANYSEILKSIQTRDEIDSSRVIAPLRPAEDAVILNSDNKSIEVVFEEVMKLLDRDDTNRG
ncbi:MAG: (d)CMP kinase [Anaerolineaceae bacterium]